jgi:hypothetical protein
LNPESKAAKPGPKPKITIVQNPTPPKPIHQTNILTYMKEDKGKKKRKKFGDGDSSPNEASDSSFIVPGDIIHEEPDIK